MLRRALRIWQVLILQSLWIAIDSSLLDGLTKTLYKPDSPLNSNFLWSFAIQNFSLTRKLQVRVLMFNKHCFRSSCLAFEKCLQAGSIEYLDSKILIKALTIRRFQGGHPQKARLATLISLWNWVFLDASLRPCHTLWQGSCRTIEIRATSHAYALRPEELPHKSSGSLVVLLRSS